MNSLKILYNFFGFLGVGGGGGIDLFSIGKPQEVKKRGTCKGEFQASFPF
jgi:hypothetical protein